jgi:DNA-binding HxlR family transcriptional regulator
MRSYGEHCAIAKSLDLIGDRWSLLIVRELMIRDACRYTDLKYGLPGIATNLLADRLRELEAADVVKREEAPPPVATTLFRLTPRGEELRPVINGLLRWGLPLMRVENPTDTFRSHWLAGALEQTLSDQRPDEPPVALELRTGDRPIVIEAGGGEIGIGLQPAEQPDGILTGPPKALVEVVRGMLDLSAAEEFGVSFEGDRSVLGRIGPREPAGSVAG